MVSLQNHKYDISHIEEETSLEVLEDMHSYFSKIHYDIKTEIKSYNLQKDKSDDDYNRLLSLRMAKSDYNLLLKRIFIRIKTVQKQNRLKTLELRFFKGIAKQVLSDELYSRIEYKARKEAEEELGLASDTRV